MLPELRAFAAQFGTRRPLFPRDPDVAREGLFRLLTCHVLLVAKRMGSEKPEPAGFIGGWKLPHPMNPEIELLSEVFWWVLPAFRGTRAGAALLEAFVREGERLGVDWITCALEAGSAVKAESLERRGFRGLERSFVREVG